MKSILCNKHRFHGVTYPIAQLSEKYSSSKLSIAVYTSRRMSDQLGTQAHVDTYRVKNVW